jgi:hypothetical protein
MIDYTNIMLHIMCCPIVWGIFDMKYISILAYYSEGSGFDSNHHH